jgi:hypothetical protein
MGFAKQPAILAESLTTENRRTIRNYCNYLILLIFSKRQQKELQHGLTQGGFKFEVQKVNRDVS